MGKKPLTRKVVVTIIKTDDDEQVVYGEVYAPYRLDAHGEFMFPDDIKKMAHRFMQLPLNNVIDTQHDNVPNGSYPIESFIARDDDPDYTAGSWVLGVHIPDGDLWKKVKNGKINAYSFEAMVTPQEAEIEYYVMRDHVGYTQKSEDHVHAYFVQLDPEGNVINGYTSPGLDGHVHRIVSASITEREDGHSHRFFM